jgi:ribose 5-phosphate isomerase A
MAIVIESDDWEETAEEIDDLFLGDAEVARRSFDPDANPRGGQSPVVTGNMHMILDVAFYEGLKLIGKPVSYEEIIQEIENVPGVVAIGLVTGASRAILPDADGHPQLLRIS